MKHLAATIRNALSAPGSLPLIRSQAEVLTVRNEFLIRQAPECVYCSSMVAVATSRVLIPASRQIMYRK